MITDLLVKKFDGTYEIDFVASPREVLASIGSDFTFVLSNITTQILGISSYTDTLYNVIVGRSVDRFYSTSVDGITYTTEKPFSAFSDLVFDTHASFHLKLRYVRTGTDTTSFIEIEKVNIFGNWDIAEIEGVAELTEIDQCKHIVTTNLYKVFSITGFDIVDNGNTLTKGYSVRYRITQDFGRSWSPWELLTTQNITTYKVDPVRFFKIEYAICRTGTDTSGVVKVYEIDLLGDIQDVKKNYTKINKFGIRECCLPNSSLNSAAGFGSSNPDGALTLATNSNCVFPMSNNSANCPNGPKFDPYKIAEASTLYNFLANTVVQPFGWEVKYWKLDVDENGIDRELHEYQLYERCEPVSLKVMVPDNQFPDNQITFNAFNLDLFESFEIHITKDTFKNAFGIEARPAKQDFLFMCVNNRYYKVEHAQAYKDFLNMSVYYKLTLVKGNQQANIRDTNDASKDAFDTLMNNSTLDDLFGDTNKAENKRVSKAQEQPMTQQYDKIRRTIHKKTKVTSEEMLNASLVVSEYYYDLNKVPTTDIAVDYGAADPILTQGQNRSVVAWFKFDVYSTTVKYTILDNYDTTTNKGYKIEVINNTLVFTLNANTFVMNSTFAKNIWYCYQVNIDQRQRSLTQNLFKRATTIDVNGNEIGAEILQTSALSNLHTQSYDLVPTDFNLNLNMKFYGNTMRLTNIRVFDDVIVPSTYTKVLNQQIIRSADHLIIGDNAEPRIYTPNHA